MVANIEVPDLNYLQVVAEGRDGFSQHGSRKMEQDTLREITVPFRSVLLAFDSVGSTHSVETRNQAMSLLQMVQRVYNLAAQSDYIKAYAELNGIYNAIMIRGDSLGNSAEDRIKSAVANGKRIILNHMSGQQRSAVESDYSEPNKKLPAHDVESAMNAFENVKLSAYGLNYSDALDLFEGRLSGEDRDTVIGRMGSEIQERRETLDSLERYLSEVK